jgi:protein O-GlcNAc transferase
MTSKTSAEWLARGRSHQREGRAVDAMTCFRRALRETPQSVDVRFHLGEVLWQLGCLPDAIAIWREASKLAPQQRASHQALAEALIATGEYSAAADVAAHALELAPDDYRSLAISSIAALRVADNVAATRALCETIARHPDVLSVPAIGGSLALILDLRPQRQGREAILDAVLANESITSRFAALPAPLLACVIERLAKLGEIGAPPRGVWIDALLARPWAVSDHDALRRVALAVAFLTPPAPSPSVALAQHYAAVCAREDRGGAPVMWPRRTGGERLRVVVLPGSDDVAWQAEERLRALPGDRFDVTVMRADGATAHRLAALDADVAIDLAGLTSPVGTILAPRPARIRMTMATLRACNYPPLIDETAGDLDELVGALERLRASIEEGGQTIPDAQTMDTLWADAVDAHRAGNPTAAQLHYQHILALQPAFARAHYLLGVALREQGAIDQARAEFAATLRAAPGYVAARVDAIRIAIDAGDVGDAIALAEQGIAMTEDPPPALLRAFGSASLAAHDGARAAGWFEAALLREPIDGETHYNHGVALQLQRRHHDAARAYQRALAFNPDLIAADFNLGTIFAELGNRDAAISAFSAVLTRNPKQVAAYKNRGELLFASGRIDAWRGNFHQFESNCPDALPLAVHALEVCQWCGEFDRVEHYLDGLRNERFNSQDVREMVDSLEELLYLLLYFDVEPELIHRLAQTYDHASRRIYGEPLPRIAHRRQGRIRIGYLSADLRNHVMGKMMWQAVRHHDRERFEIALYSLSEQRDDWTERFRDAAARFEVLAGLPEREAAARIAADDMDVLVDLSTHTKGARPGILALKPARVQITHVASAGTLGLSAVDFKLTDRYADVAENQLHQLETLLPMAGCVYPYRHIEGTKERKVSREMLGVPADAVLIGAFVSGLKLSRRCLSLWRQVLERLPTARLVFSPVNAAFAPLYAHLVGAAGIDVGRIVFVPQSTTDSDNQARYALVDFVLDPMPYGGVNGTLEALDMGVPVVTLVGRRHAERTSFSILSNLGVTQTIAQSGSEYVAIAAKLATDRSFMAEVRGAIRAGLSSSSLTDMPAHTRNLEAAYIEALRRKAPEVLAVSAGAVVMP